MDGDAANRVGVSVGVALGVAVGVWVDVGEGVVVGVADGEGVGVMVGATAVCVEKIDAAIWVAVAPIPISEGVQDPK
ncbi:MAG: hypothetical protein KA773_23740 [Chloroflexi bacterium]|nr:hypothetical protein [Chloroflexota bacterium]